MRGTERKQKASLEPVMYKSLSPQMEATGTGLGGHREPAKSFQELPGRKRRCCLLNKKEKALGRGPVVSGIYSLLAQQDGTTLP